MARGWGDISLVISLLTWAERISHMVHFSHWNSLWEYITYVKYYHYYQDSNSWSTLQFNPDGLLTHHGTKWYIPAWYLLCVCIFLVLVSRNRPSIDKQIKGIMDCIMLYDHSDPLYVNKLFHRQTCLISNPTIIIISLTDHVWKLNVWRGQLLPCELYINWLYHASVQQ